MLASREGVGKSTLVGAAAAAVSSGAPWLGAPTLRGSVLVLDLEEHPSDLLRRLALFDADPDAVTVAFNPERPLRELADAAAAIRPAMVVVDSLAALAAASGLTEAGSSAQWTPLLSALLAIARSTGAAVVAIHHAVKGGDDYRDSTAIGATADIVGMLSRPSASSPVRTLRYPKHRFHVDELTLHFNGRDYTAGDGSLAARVELFVAANPGSSKRGIRQGITGRDADKDAALAALVAAGRVELQGQRYHLSQRATLPATLGPHPTLTAQTIAGQSGPRSGHAFGHATVAHPYMGVGHTREQSTEDDELDTLDGWDRAMLQ